MTPAPAASPVPAYNKHINEIEADGNTGDTTMQQAIYNSTTINGNNGIAIPAAKTAPTARRASLARRIARRWDMIGVLALMGSSAAYAVFALAHVGL